MNPEKIAFFRHRKVNEKAIILSILFINILIIAKIPLIIYQYFDNTPFSKIN